MKNISKRLSTILCLIFLLVSSFLTYSNSLESGFMLDDHAFFDEIMRNPKYMYVQFIPDKDKYLGVEGMKADAYYRPLAHVIPMICYLNFRHNVVGYHTFNLILFWLTGCAIFGFILLISSNQLLALFTALGYVIHPINGVFVNYITANVFAAQILFMLASITIALRIITNPKPKFYLYILCAITMFGAFMCHETSLATPIYLIAFLIVFKKENWIKALKQTSWLFGIVFVYFLWRLKFASLNSSILSHFQMFQMSIFEYTASMGKLLTWYFGKLFFPNGIVLIYATPVVRDHLLMWNCALIGYLSIFGFLFLRWRQHKYLLLGLVWFFLGFLPFTQACLFQPTHGPMIEPHWFVFSIIGFFLILGSFFTELWQSNPKWFNRILVSLVLVYWMNLSTINNYIWSNEKRYCHYWLTECPTFSSAIFYLAKAHELDREYIPARALYEEALKYNYKVYLTLTNLGLLDLMENKWKSAEEHFLKALDLDPDMAITVSNLGTVYFKEEDYVNAKKYFEKSIKIDKFAPLPRLNLAKTLIKLGDENGAIKLYESIIDIDPRNELAHTLLFRYYWDHQSKEKTIFWGRQIIKISENPQTLTNVGKIFAYYKLKDEALTAFKKAVKLYPDYKEAYIEAGKIMKVNP